VGALLLGRERATFQGEVAQALGFAAAGRPEPAYAFALDRAASPWQIDLRPAVRGLVRDLQAGRPAAQLADRFHATLVAAGAAVVEAALRLVPEARRAERRVVLAGGCFQNPLLVSGFERRLGETFEVLRAVQLSPGDGGLAFGQALVAAAVVESEAGARAAVIESNPRAGAAGRAGEEA
jgi:hydrogenase maturation protein HypF